jgi:hypothetical protein
MNTQKLQEQADIIESKILQVAGSLAVFAHMNKLHLDQEADNLGEAINALLEIKQELGLTSNLKREG